MFFIYIITNFKYFCLDHKIMTKLSGKRQVFVQVGIHNTSRKIHLLKLKFAKTKTNNIRDFLPWEILLFLFLILKFFK